MKDIMVPITNEHGQTRMVERYKCSMVLRDAVTKDGQRVKVGSDRAYFIKDDGSFVRAGAPKLTKKERKHMKKVRRQQWQK